MHTSGDGKWQSLICPSEGWPTWLGGSGIPFSLRESTHVNALGGSAAWAFRDEGLKRLLAGSLLLDGPTAAILIERGFGEMIGFKSGRMVENYKDGLYAIERCTDAELSLRKDAMISVNMIELLFQGELAPGARAISEMLHPTRKHIGHGAVVSENQLGGRVAVVPFDANAEPRRLDPQRVGQLRKVVSWLDRRQMVGSVSGGAWLIPRFLTDGRIWRGAIWNGCQGAVREVLVQPA